MKINLFSTKIQRIMELTAIIKAPSLRLIKTGVKIILITLLTIFQAKALI